jgi:hypothetical protein
MKELQTYDNYYFGKYTRDMLNIHPSGYIRLHDLHLGQVFYDFRLYITLQRYSTHITRLFKTSDFTNFKFGPRSYGNVLSFQRVQHRIYITRRLQASPFIWNYKYINSMACFSSAGFGFPYWEGGLFSG